MRYDNRSELRLLCEVDLKSRMVYHDKIGNVWSSKSDAKDGKGNIGLKCSKK